MNLAPDSPRPSDAERSSLEAALGSMVRFDHDDAPVGDGHTYGGKNLTSCTSGFTV